MLLVQSVIKQLAIPDGTVEGQKGIPLKVISIQIAKDRYTKAGLAIIMKKSLALPINASRAFLCKMGKRKKCYVCGNSVAKFTRYAGSTKSKQEFWSYLQTVGSDTNNFGCVYCGSFDRERHLFMFFDNLKIWEKFGGSTILHFAPEKHLSQKISDLPIARYVRADLEASRSSGVERIDVTRIPYTDNSFDFVICNHVLEHVPDYLSGLKEIYRVLKPNGTAILQTPYSKLLSRNFEEQNIKTGTLRRIFYGQENHVRLFSEKHFFSDLEAVGFKLGIVRNNSLFDDAVCSYYGVNRVEDLIRVIKAPASEDRRKDQAGNLRVNQHSSAL